MHVDDRLATVLHAQGLSKTGLRIQYRQLLDLVGTSPAHARGELLDTAMVRLSELAGLIEPEHRARAIAEAGVRLRNPSLVALLAADHPQVAMAAIRAARLDAAQWLDLIPAIPLAARGLLRLRRDLGPDLERRLDDLGITDRALPSGKAQDQSLEQPAPVPAHALALSETAEPTPRLSVAPAPGSEGIAAIVRRIEAFRASRESHGTPQAANDHPRLPLGEAEPAPARSTAFSFSTDSAGRIGWADAQIAPMVVGILLPAVRNHGADETDLPATFRRRQPLRAVQVELDGAPGIAGPWQLDAAPDFDGTGRFTGYLGRIRRPAPPREAARNPEADRIRQVLHELRTPVNAIQGFAEIIQQQLFGATPHEYRALAATIAGDAARMLAGFEELDRYARLDSGVLTPEAGSTDLAMVVAGIVHQLEAFTGARSSGFALAAPSGECCVALAPAETEHLAWRLLATLAGAARPGEVLSLELERGGQNVRLTAQLPEGLAVHEDPFEAVPPQAGQAINAGVFGNGFTLRLAAAEARAAGGSLERYEDTLILTLPDVPGEAVSDYLQNSANNPLSSAC